MSGFMLAGKVTKSYGNFYTLKSGETVNEHIVVIGFFGGKVTTKGPAEDSDYRVGDEVFIGVDVDVIKFGDQTRIEYTRTGKIAQSVPDGLLMDESGMHLVDTSTGEVKEEISGNAKKPARVNDHAAAS